MDAGFARIEQHLVQIDERFVRIDDRFAGIDQRFVLMDRRMERMEDRFDAAMRMMAQVGGGLIATAALACTSVLVTQL